MKSSKILTVILVMIAIIVVGFFALNYYFTRSGIKMPEGWNDQRYYRILYMSATKNTLDVKYYFILDKDGKVIETRILETGNIDELVTEANFISKFTPINYDVEQKDNSFVYSTTVFNGKTTDEVKSSFNNVEDSIIKNIVFTDI